MVQLAVGCRDKDSGHVRLTNKIASTAEETESVKKLETNDSTTLGPNYLSLSSQLINSRSRGYSKMAPLRATLHWVDSSISSTF